MGAMRLEIVPIHLLRSLGYEAADETAAVRHRETAVKSCADVGGALPATASGIAFPF